MEGKDKIKLVIIGLILVAIGAFALGYNIYMGRYYNLLWFCYIGLVLLGLGAIFRNGDLIMTQLNILTIPLLIWIVDFGYYYFFNRPLFGISNYFFEPSYGAIDKFISIQHLFTLPLAFYALSIIKIREIDMWSWSFGQAVLTYVITLLFVSAAYNINYINSISFLTIDLGRYYPLAWMGVAFIGVYATNAVIAALDVFNR